MLRTTKFCQNQPLATKINFAFFLVIFSIILVLSGCGGGANEDEEGTRASDDTYLEVTMRDSPDATGKIINNVEAGKTAWIHAKLVSPDGGPMENELITFSTNLGILDSSNNSEATGSDGVATIKFTADVTKKAGNVIAEATAANGTENFSDTFVFAVEGSVESPNPGQNPSTAQTLSLRILNADGITTRDININSIVKVQAILLDAFGEGVADKQVKFTAGRGTLSPDTVLTSATGIAEIELNSGTEIGASVITAVIVEDNVEKLRTEYAYQIKDTTGNQGLIPTLSIQIINEAGNNTRDINKNSFVSVVATLLDSDESGVPSKQIVFTAGRGSLTPTSALTNSEGLAKVELGSGSEIGAAVLTASVIESGTETLKSEYAYQIIDSSNNPTNIEVPVLTIRLLDINGTQIRDVDRGSTFRAEARFLSASGEGIPFKQIVFSTEHSTLSPTSTLTNASGIAVVDFNSGSEIGANVVSAAVIENGAATYQSEYAYQLIEDVDDINKIEAPTFTLSLLDSENLQVRDLDRNSTVLIEATLLNPDQTGIANQVITFTTELGAVLPESGTALTNEDGKATVELSTESIVGAGNIIASTEINEELVTIKYGFQITGNPNETPEPTPEPPPEEEEGNVSKSVTGSIQFVSALPKTIVLRNTGGEGYSEFSNVTFKLIGTDGLPMEGRTIRFTLSETTTIGGLAIDPLTAITNSEGLVSTTVQAGSMPTVVSVKATTTVQDVNDQDQELVAYSNDLVVSTGRPDQNSFSLSLSVQNPEAWEYDGVEVDVTARLADHFNNWVPDGTAVYFTTEGGSIESSCKTVNSACTVKWISQNPRPEDHRVTIMATTLGNESFVDTDSDGVYTLTDGEPFTDVLGNNDDRNIFEGNDVYDEPFVDLIVNSQFDEPFIGTIYKMGDVFIDYNNNGIFDGIVDNPAGESEFTDSNNGNGEYDGTGRIPSGELYTDVVDNDIFDAPGFADLGEPYLDENENGVYDLGERYRDTNNNGVIDLVGDGKYNGILCQQDNNCSNKDVLDIRESAVLIMSGTDPNIVITGSDPSTIYSSNVEHLPANSSIDISNGGVVYLNAYITDNANQVLPAGTEISVSCGKCIADGGWKMGSTIGSYYYRSETDKERAFESMFSMGILLTTEPPKVHPETGLVILLPPQWTSVTLTIKFPSGKEVTYSFGIFA